MIDLSFFRSEIIVYDENAQDNVIGADTYRHSMVGIMMEAVKCKMVEHLMKHSTYNRDEINLITDDFIYFDIKKYYDFKGKREHIIITPKWKNTNTITHTEEAEMIK